MGCSTDHPPFTPPAGAPKSFCVLTTLSASGTAEAQELADMLEILVEDNMRWIQSVLDLGVEPPCCSKCGGIKYRDVNQADYEAGAILYKCAPDMFHDGVGACGSIAAYDVAAMRVLEQVDAWIVVKPSEDGQPSSYHAVVGTPAGEHDPTLEMEAG